MFTIAAQRTQTQPVRKMPQSVRNHSPVLVIQWAL